jgi:hypothetical protein
VPDELLFHGDNPVLVTEFVQGCLPFTRREYRNGEKLEIHIGSFL